MFGADRLLTNFDHRAQDVFRFAVGALFDEQIADGVLDLGPLSWITLAIGQLLGRAEMFHGGLELDSFLRGEGRQFQGLNNLGRLGIPGLLRFVHRLQGETLRFKIILRDIGSVSPFIAGRVRRALQIGGHLRKFLTQERGVDVELLRQLVVDPFLEGGGIFLGLRLAHPGFHLGIV